MALNKLGYRPKWEKITWYICRGLLVVWLVYTAFHFNDHMQRIYFLQALFGLIFTYLWDMFQIFGGKSFIVKVSSHYQTVLTLFITFACICGTFLQTYTKLPLSDKAIHFTSGIIASTFGYDLINLIQKDKDKKLKPTVAALFALCFAMGIAEAWEFYEFLFDTFHATNLQCSTPSPLQVEAYTRLGEIFHAKLGPAGRYGLIDTMTDMMMGTLGGLTGMFVMVRYRVKQSRKTNVISKIKSAETVKD